MTLPTEPTHTGPDTGIDAVLARLQAGLDRCAPADLPRRLAAGDLVVDTRPVDQRERDGALAGAVVVDRNVLEWRLDPTTATCIVEARAGRPVVLVCNEGYSSTLAAVQLRELGVDATDLAGGVQAMLVSADPAVRALLVGPVVDRG